MRECDAWEFWEEFLGFHIGPWEFWVGSYRPFRVRYHRTETSHIFRIRVGPEVKKEEVKARLVEPSILEIEWPRKIRGEEMPIELL